MKMKNEKHKDFESEFAKNFKDQIAKHKGNGSQPLFEWVEGKNPKFSKDFLALLSDSDKKSLRELIQSSS